MPFQLLYHFVEIKQCKCMVVLRDFPQYCLVWAGDLLTPVRSLDMRVVPFVICWGDDADSI